MIMRISAGSFDELISVMVLAPRGVGGGGGLPLGVGNERALLMGGPAPLPACPPPACPPRPGERLDARLSCGAAGDAVTLFPFLAAPVLLLAFFPFASSFNFADPLLREEEI